MKIKSPSIVVVIAVIALGATLSALGCQPETASVEQQPIAADGNATLSAPRETAVEICAGARTSTTGERCTELHEDAHVLTCSHSITREFGSDGRVGDSTSTVRLELADDGSFVIKVESSTSESWTSRGRRIETSTGMSVEYTESTSGAGHCRYGDGDSIPCHRDDPLQLEIGGDPCTRDFLGPRVEG